MRVERVLIVLSSGFTGYDLIVRRNVAGSVQPVWETAYSALSWAELVDTLLCELESAHPGWELDEGLRFQQTPLWDL